MIRKQKTNVCTHLFLRGDVGDVNDATKLLIKSEKRFGVTPYDIVVVGFIVL